MNLGPRPEILVVACPPTNLSPAYKGARGGLKQREPHGMMDVYLYLSGINECLQSEMELLGSICLFECGGGVCDQS